MPRGVYKRISKKEIVKPKKENPETIVPEPEIAVPPVEKIVPRGENCQCTHGKELHYGGLKGHCNSMGCRCSEFQ